ncbi:hypothetical protein ONS95_002958 [Cadophora gregata]|uniref:uncharacterized protein n=1 Tax=Cadophora gregata TaxID=51156 RepID=UPI0026DCCC37|nr:uncharacterized protein ONS95_002958 [Cadophora gregata]KAK0108136.1 hypothetical protein ONS95_002958 [Cadophora gregata]
MYSGDLTTFIQRIAQRVELIYRKWYSTPKPVQTGKKLQVERDGEVYKKMMATKAKAVAQISRQQEAHAEIVESMCWKLGRVRRRYFKPEEARVVKVKETRSSSNRPAEKDLR